MYNYHENTSIELVMYGNYIKYENMMDLTLKAFKDSDAENVNIYIDMYQMMLSLYKLTRIEDYTAISASMINLCAHIRAYYRSRHRVETKIFIVYSDNSSTSTTNFEPNYNKHYSDRMQANKQMYDNIKSNLKLLKLLCPYLPNIHLVTGTFEPGVIMYDLICKQDMLGNCDPNIIFSKSIYNYQLPALMPNTVIFRNIKSRKSNTLDTCKAITTSNVLKEYLYETRNTTFKEWSDIDDIDPSLLSMIMTLSNLPSRNMKSVFNIKTAVSVLNEAVTNTKIINGYNTDIWYAYNQLNNIKRIPIPVEAFCNRFNAIDLRTQLILYVNAIESKDTSYLLSLHDDNTVKEINNKYFKNNPLDLNRL